MYNGGIIVPCRKCSN